MKRIAILLASMALAPAAFAQATLPDVPDTDGSGSWSLVELQAVWTDLTEETFKAVDTTADGNGRCNRTSGRARRWRDHRAGSQDRRLTQSLVDDFVTPR